jgi:hypothetical protein
MKSCRTQTLLAALVGFALPAWGGEVRPWKPAGISSPQFESHAAFDPRTGDLYFVRSSPTFEGWRILVSRCGKTGWSEPKEPPFAGDGVEADPWFPRHGPDGWLYFGSNRPGGAGSNDIWRARADAAGRWTLENLGAAINTAGDEYEPLPSVDGSRMIVMADGGFYETRMTKESWSPRVKLGPEVNANGTEIGAQFSPSGKSLLFARDTKGRDSGEFFVWHEFGVEPWPPECPGAHP